MYAINDDLSSKSVRIIRVYAGWTYLMHFYAVFIIFSNIPEVASDVRPSSGVTVKEVDMDVVV